MGSNLGFVYYINMYNFSATGIQTNRDSCMSLLNRGLDNDDELFYSADENQSFVCWLAYPGLLTGTGMPHGIKEDNNDFKAGFYFDHTYGLPVIPGSSVKGLLRSVFPNRIRHKNTSRFKKDTKAGWILAQFEHINDPDFLENTFEPIENALPDQIEWVNKLELEIFEGINYETGKNKSLYSRDIIHDAVIHEADPHRKIVGTDYITPHLNPLKNPIPIKLLKILPEVSLLFQFDLKPGLISVGDKIKLFQKIILTMGIGAKTNVGYGQFQ